MPKEKTTRTTTVRTTPYARAPKAAARAGRAAWGGRFADPEYRAEAMEIAAVARGNLRTGGFLGQELKYFDTSLAASAMVAPTDAAGGEHDPATLLTLFCPTQGTGATNRDGRRAVMKSIQISGNLRSAPQINQAAIDLAGDYYVALVLDKQTNAAQMNSEDVFANPSASAVLAAAPLRDLERSTRFQVLKQWKGRFPQPVAVYDGTNIEVGGWELPFTYYSKLNIGVEFVANGGTVADIQDNSLHLVAYCTNTGLAATVNYNCRIRYVG